MDLGIAGRTALLAGSSAGMGKEAARALAREGARLVMSARGEERLRSSAQEIMAETDAVVSVVVADHGTAEGRKKLLDACPTPDILIVTCSSPRITDTYEDISPSEWTESLDTTLVGPIELMRAIVPAMAERGYGRVINIGTVAAKYPMQARLLSGPARAALTNYTGALARVVAPRNVAINNILPGMFDTANVRTVFDARAAQNGTTYDVEIQKWAALLRIPAARFGDPADVGAFCALLASRYASYLIGQSIVLDGGIVNALF